MDMHRNLCVGNPNNAQDVETAGSLDRAISLSNQATQAEAAGDLAQAIELHNQAAALKIRAFGEESIQAALSLNGLGECYLQTGNLAKAEESLLKALRVRDDRRAGGLGIGPRFDAAVTREYVAQLREAQGRFADAREMRKRGANKGQMACGWNKCPGQCYSKSQLKACSGCSSVWYCCKECQRADWQARHKPLCKQHGAAAKAAATES